MTADRTFLNWLADRLVSQYGENPGMDFVLKTRNIAASLPAERDTPNMSVVLEPTEEVTTVPLAMMRWAIDMLAGYDLVGTGSGPSDEEAAEHDAKVARMKDLFLLRGLRPDAVTLARHERIAGQIIAGHHTAESLKANVINKRLLATLIVADFRKRIDEANWRTIMTEMTTLFGSLMSADMALANLAAEVAIEHGLLPSKL